MDFRIHNKFSHDGREWAVGEYNNRKDGQRDFANAIHAVDGSQSYGMIPTVEEGQVTDVRLTSKPEVAGLDMATLAPELRNRFASALEWSAKQAGSKVEPEMLDAIREGRNLKSERESEAEFQRETRNADFDLESAYLLRDALKEQVHEAFDAGRDDEAKAAAKQLAAVKEDIQGYWNPHKERPIIERKLTSQQEEEVELFGMVVDTDIDRDAAKLAAAHFGQEELDANARGDKKAAAQAGEKAQTYAERVQAERERGGEASRSL